MQKIFNFISIVIIVFAGFYFIKNNEKIIGYELKNISNIENIEKPTPNSYYKEYNFAFVKQTNNFTPENKQDILNIIYTSLNSGSDSFSFYCSSKYKECLDDIDSLSKDNKTLSVINNMVSPFNSYNKLYIATNKLGKVTITLDKLYSDDDIKKINEKMNIIINEVTNDNMKDEEKIKKIHDYLINHTKYDSERANNIKSGNDSNPKYSSHKATGPLFEGMGLCSGYSDAMKIYLDILNIPNYKISNTEHIWNLVYINNTWLHLDLTWDDPVTTNNQDVLLDTFFLINTNELLKNDPEGHLFDKNYYIEA